MSEPSAPAELIAVVITNIRAIRKAHGWSQTDLAARSDGRLDRGKLTKIENGRRGVTLQDLEALGTALGVEPWRLLRPLRTAVVVLDGPEFVSQPAEEVPR